MKPKDWITKTTKERIVKLFGRTQLNNSQETSPWFLGKINPDKTKITDPQGKEYNLSFTGNPKSEEVALRLTDKNAVVYAPDVAFFQVDSSPSLPLVACRDGTWIYLRRLGDNRRFYLPIHEFFNNFQTNVNNYQCRLSSNGKGVFLGTVVENPDDHHQMGIYGYYKDFQLVPYTEDSFNTFPSLASFNYPISPGESGYVVLGTPAGFNIIDLNSFTDGNVPVPEFSQNGSDAMMFPFGYLGSLNYSFNVQTLFEWSTIANLQPSNFPTVQASDESYGRQNFVWNSTPNSSLFKSYTYVFNNTLDGEYKADIITDHVNCYMFGLVSTNWIEGYQLFNHNDIGGGNFSDVTLQWDETLISEFTYIIPADYAYHLVYLSTPDLWISDVDITVVPQHHTWDSNGKFIQVEPGINRNDSWTFDKIVRDYTTFPPDGAFDSSGRVYRLFYTTGYPLPFVNDGQDYLNVQYYNGVYRQFSPSGIFNFFGNYYRPYTTSDPGENTGLESSYYMEINFDSAFPITIFPSPIVHTIFVGRSMSTITDLLTNPNLYGIVSQKLSDGSDFDTIIKGFRGRSGAISNTAFVYQQNYNSVYFYSAPYLARGNLSGIQGTGEAINDTSSVYSSAIAGLVTLNDYATVYDNISLQTQIQQAIGFYQNKQAAPQDLLNTIYAGTLALSEDLGPAVNQIRSTLADLNAALNGEMSILGPDVIGFEPPDVFSDRIFSTFGTWPIYHGGFLKAVDSFIVQELYVSEGSEYVQTYNVAQDGLTTMGKAAASSIQNGCDTVNVLDYVLPIKEEDTVG